MVLCVSLDQPPMLEDASTLDQSDELSVRLQRQLEVAADAQRNFQVAEAKYKLLYGQLSAKYRGELLEQKSLGKQAFGLALDNADLASRLNTDAAVLAGERVNGTTPKPKVLESKPSGRMDVELAVCARVQQNPAILQQRRLIRSLESKLSAALEHLSQAQDAHSKVSKHHPTLSPSVDGGWMLWPVIRRSLLRVWNERLQSVRDDSTASTPCLDLLFRQSWTLPVRLCGC